MRPFRRLGGVLAGLLLLLLGNLSWVQVLDAKAIRSQSGNTRQLLGQYHRQRGPILVESVPIATSTQPIGEDVFQRSYTDGPLFAAITGYSSLLYGATGIERAEDNVLSGTDDRLFVDRVQQLFAGRQPAGGAVGLTIDRDAQVAAFQALREHRGAAVALDARTGAVLALVSAPSFDPQSLAPNDPPRVRAAYSRLSEASGQPLVNRALDRLYPIAGAFALVTAGTALGAPGLAADTVLPAPARLRVGDTIVETADDRPCTAPGRITLARALITDCRTALAEAGLRIGLETLTATARRLGFRSLLGTPLPAQRSVLGTGTAPSLAVGEGVQASVMQLAVMVAAIPNGGAAMRPYLVQDLRGPDLALLERTLPRRLGRAMDADAAQELARVLRAAARSSNCPGCAPDDITVHALLRRNAAGDAVFVGYSGHVAVAVVVEREDVDPGRAAVDAGLGMLRAVFGDAT